jgi:hypothetical protein
MFNDTSVQVSVLLMLLHCNYPWFVYLYIYIDKYVCLYIYIYIPERNDGACQ